MNRDTFSMARQAYAAKDYQNALGLFTMCLQDTAAPPQPGEVGLIYHQMGNCLVKLGKANDAVSVYLQAVNDSAYEGLGAVYYNLGSAQASLRNYEAAIPYFEKAIVDERYTTPYKAYTGLGSAYMKLGKSAEAGIAFREAALDASNPDPSKALLSLGVCFMALDRPEDAITSYESAMQFDMSPMVKNKLYANLGQAYVAAGEMKKAVEAFEDALADRSYFLSDSASVDYQTAMAAVEQASKNDAAGAGRAAHGEAEDAYAGLDAEGAYGYGAPNGYDAQQTAYLPNQDAADGGYEGMGKDAFFEASNEQIEQWSKERDKQERKKKHRGLKVFLIILLVVVVLAVAGGIFAYTQGYGFPTQESTVQKAFDDPTETNEAFASSLDAASVAAMCDIMEDCQSITIEQVDRSMAESTVYVTGTTKQGGTIRYKVSLVRDKVGWKISNVELYFLSQGQTSSSGTSASSSTKSSSSSSSSTTTTSPSASASASSSSTTSPSASATTSPSASSAQ